MGPAPQHKDLPSRPKFSWDAKSPPWTDGRGDQEEYRDAVALWQPFHNALPDNNSNKFPTALQAICLKSQLYGRAKDLCSGITDAQLVGEDAVSLIVGQIYKRDALSVVSDAYKSINLLLNTRRVSSESMKNFESRFSAQVAKLNSISDTTKLPECITALMLLSNSAIGDAQRVSVMAVAAPSASDLNAQSSNDQYLAAITYASVSSVIKQCDKAVHSNASQTSGTLAAGSGSMNRSHNRHGDYSRNRTKISPTMKYPCDTCGKYGHWKRKHRADGSLPPGVKSFDTPQVPTEQSSRQPKSENQNVGDISSTESKKKAISFNMATLDEFPETSVSTGPLVDSGAPYCAIGIVELNMLADHFGLHPNPKLGTLPKMLRGYNSWQYGTGDHAGPSRKILGSISLTATSDTGVPVRIVHVVLEGSSQWVIGRNVTSRVKIEDIGRNDIVFVSNGVEHCISTISRNFLSFIQLDRFIPSTMETNIKQGSTLSCISAISLTESSWSDVKRMIDKIHKHVCGHASFSDFKLLLERNSLWNDAVSHYLSELVNACPACRSTATPQPSRKVPISSLSKALNEVLCIDHLFLEGLCLFHCMDLHSRYSACHVVRTTSLSEAVIGFEACWNSQFWLPDSLLCEKAFAVGDFKEYADSVSIPIKNAPPQRHHKNPIESKHNIIRSVFLRLKAASDANVDPVLAAYRAVTISNDLYGNEIMSAFEMAEGFTKPVNVCPADTVILADVREAQEQLQALRKLALILRSKAVTEVPLSVGDSVEIYQKKDTEKRGRWSTPKPIPSIDISARSVTVPGASGRSITAAFEDARPSLPQHSFAQIVQHGLDSIDESIQDIARLELQPESTISTQVFHPDNPDTDVSSESPSENPNTVPDSDFSADRNNSPSVGDRVDVPWDEDSVVYPSTVHSEYDDGRMTIHYDNGDIETVDMTTVQWNHSTPLSGSSGKVTNDLHVISSEHKVLSPMLEHFGKKPFLKYRAQGFDQYPLVNAYTVEEETLLKTSRPVYHRYVPKGANVISSHTIYKVKRNDDGTLKLKAHIDPHGNEDDLKDILNKDCTTCPQTGLRVLESIASLLGWQLYKADVTAAFLQTGAADRDVNVRPPTESRMRSSHMWLFLTAAYGLVNSNAKWQPQSDAIMIELGLLQSKYIPQLFYKKRNGKLVLLVAKIVDDLKVAGHGNNAKVFLESFDQKFKFGTVSHGPGKMRFFGINTIQHDDSTIDTNAEDKIEAVTEYPLLRQRRKESDSPLNAIEKSSFASTNSSVDWIGTAASPLCSFYSSYLQQKAPNTQVHYIVEKNAIVRQLKKFGTTISYPRPEDSMDYELSVLVFADASRVYDVGQLGTICGLLVGPMRKDYLSCRIMDVSQSQTPRQEYTLC